MFTDLDMFRTGKTPSSKKYLKSKVCIDYTHLFSSSDLRLILSLSVSLSPGVCFLSTTLILPGIQPDPSGEVNWSGEVGVGGSSLGFLLGVFYDIKSDDLQNVIKSMIITRVIPSLKSRRQLPPSLFTSLLTHSFSGKIPP